MPLSFTLDTVGPPARTAEDCDLILSIIAGADPLDPMTANAPAWKREAARRSPAGMMVGIPQGVYMDGLESDIDRAFDDATATFKALAVNFVEVVLPDQALLTAAAMIVLGTEGPDLPCALVAHEAGRLQPASSQPAGNRPRL